MEQERHANTGASHRLVNNFNTRAEKYVENQVGNDIGFHTTHLGKTSLSVHSIFYH